jgi:hypothetical protein
MRTVAFWLSLILIFDSHPQALASGWSQLLLDMSREERLQLGSAARQRIRERYHLEKIVDQYEHLHQSLVTGGEPGVI